MAVKWFRIWWRANGLATKIDRIFLLTWTCFLLFSNASDASISGFPIFACISVHMPHDLTKPKTVLTWNFIDLCEFHLLPYWRTLDINKNNNIENLTLMAILSCYMTMAMVNPRCPLVCSIPRDTLNHTYIFTLKLRNTATLRVYLPLIKCSSCSESGSCSISVSSCGAVEALVPLPFLGGPANWRVSPENSPSVTSFMVSTEDDEEVSQLLPPLHLPEF